jgi:hypothetical protein
MKRHWGTATLAVGLAGLGLLMSGCGSGGGSALSGGAPARTASLSGRLSAPGGAPLAGTPVVAELLIGGRTTTLRAITGTENAGERGRLIAAAESGSPASLPGVYTTTAMADGSFLFRNLPAGEYSVMARSGDLVAIQTRIPVGGSRVASASAMIMQASGTINGKVRYPQASETAPDNSGILAYVQGTSLMGFTTGSSGDYQIRGVPQQNSGATPYMIGTIAGGFADDEISMQEPLTGSSATAPLVFLHPGARLTGRISDPTITNIEQQGLASTAIVAATGQSATTERDGFFSLNGLPEGTNFLVISRSGYRTLREQIGPLEAGQNTHLNFTLQRN